MSTLTVRIAAPGHFDERQLRAARNSSCALTLEPGTRALCCYCWSKLPQNRFPVYGQLRLAERHLQN